MHGLAELLLSQQLMRLQVLKSTFGAPYGCGFDGAKTAPPLTLIFPGKTIGIYRKDGAERGVPWIEPGHVRARFDLIQTPS